MRKPGSYSHWSYKAKATTSLSFDLQSLIDQHHPIFRFLLTSVSSQSWSVGRQPSTTISNVVSCAAHCANLRQTDPCSCNAILFVRETGDCIVGTARLPLKTEDTERVFIVEGTGGLFLFEKIYQLLKELTRRGSGLESMVKIHSKDTTSKSDLYQGTNHF